MKVIEITKAPTWTDYITGLLPGEEFTAPYSKQNTICPLISGKIKLSHPEREFSTRKASKDDQDFLIVRRVK
jgi:hypothetical protein